MCVASGLVWDGTRYLFPQLPSAPLLLPGLPCSLIAPTCFAHRRRPFLLARLHPLLCRRDSEPTPELPGVGAVGRVLSYGQAGWLGQVGEACGRSPGAVLVHRNPQSFKESVARGGMIEEIMQQVQVG